MLALNRRSGDPITAFRVASAPVPPSSAPRPTGRGLVIFCPLPITSM